jgi:hypothetical protein
MVVGENPDDKNVENPNERRRVLAIVKSNLALKAESIDYRVIQQAGQPVIQWGETNSHSADDLMGLGAESSNDAATFLRELLVKGGMLSEEVEAAGKEEGYTLAQLKRAKKKAGVESVKHATFQGQWFWKIKSGP